MLITLNTVRQVLRVLGSPIRTRRVLRDLEAKRVRYFGRRRPHKLARVDGRYYWTMEAPGWPSPALNEMVRIEVGRVISQAGAAKPIRIVFLAVTKKCPLACAHCYDWANHNQREGLSGQELIEVVHTLQQRGVSQIFLSGGEPLVRYDDVLALLQAAGVGTDFWLLTSGFQLTAERALSLKAAGLTGVSVSLDHFDPDAHNRFRGLRDAFDWVVQAVRHARQAGLAVALSLCATRAFTSDENLMRYAELARRLGVPFIQVLEPRAVGRYDGADVALSAEQEQVLEDVYLRLNFDRKFRDWPIVTYHGYHQRRVGCAGAGDRFMYVDADGVVHACPFCQKSFGRLGEASLDATLATMMEAGCMAFEKAVA